MYMYRLPWWLRWQRVCMQCERSGSIPGSEKSPRLGNGSPVQYSWMENFMDREAWRAIVIKLQRDRYNRVANTHVYV